MGQDKQEICSIRIMFPVVSDEQAIDYKKKITALLAEIPEANLQFSIMSMAKELKPNASGIRSVS